MHFLRERGDGAIMSEEDFHFVLLICLFIFCLFVLFWFGPYFVHIPRRARTENLSLEDFCAWDVHMFVMCVRENILLDRNLLNMII